MSTNPSTPAARATGLVDQALSEVDDPTVPLSAVIRKAIRIARLRSDFEALLWLHAEMRNAGDEEAKRRVLQELAPHFTSEQIARMWKANTESFIVGRKIDDDRVLGDAIPEVEERITALRAQRDAFQLPAGMHPQDLYFENQRHEKMKAELTIAISEREQILARIRHRVADYLSETERQLLYGQVNANIFERNREFVDARLRDIAPDALDQFAAAYRRQGEGDTEARSHALTSCRRVLKTVADALYPATNAGVEGADGKMRKMTDDKWVSRLCQFATDSARGSASADLLRIQIATLGERLDALNDLSSKGVHANVSEFEVAQCIIQTYITVGDLLLLVENESGLNAAPEAA